MRIRGRKTKVITAILSGNCNTSRDVADETGFSVKVCSACVSKLAEIGVIRWTGRYIPVPHNRLKVFEVAA